MLQLFMYFFSWAFPAVAGRAIGYISCCTRGCRLYKPAAGRSL